MKKKIIYLVVETVARDFQANLLLALNALTRGYQIVVGQKGSLRKLAVKWPPGIFVEKSCTPQDVQLPVLHKSGHKIAISDAEGLVYIPEKYLQWRLHSDYLPLVSHFFAWGEHHKSLLQMKLPDFSGITTVGHTRLEMLKPKYHGIYQSAVQALQRQYGKFILLNTNIGTYNDYDGPERIYNQFKTKYPGFNEADLEYLKERCEYQKGVFETYISLVSQLSSKMRDVSIIVRPHPSEKIETWARAVTAPNVYVENNGNVIPWILASHAVIQRGCTTGVESVYLDKPVITYRSTNLDSRYEAEITQNIGQVCENEDAVFEALNNPVAIRTKLKADRASLSCYTSNMSLSENAAHSMIDDFDGLDVSAYEDKSKLFSSVAKTRNPLVSRMKNIAKQAIGRNPKTDKELAAQKFTDLKKDEIIHDIRLFSPLVGLNPNSLLLTQVHKDVFHITLK